MRTLIVAALLTVSAASLAPAAVVKSAPLNVALPATTTGMTINFLTGVTSADPVTNGSDFGLYFTGTVWNAFSANTAYVATTTTLQATVLNLPSGTVVGPNSIFKTSPAQTRGTLNDIDSIIGVRFINESTGLTHYGYAAVRLPTTQTNGPAGTLYWYAYESTPNTAITVVVPEPVSLTTVAGAGLLMTGRRRRA